MRVARAQWTVRPSTFVETFWIVSNSDLVADVGRVEFRRIGDVGRLPQKAGGDQRLDVARLIAVGVAPIDQLVAGDLFEQKAVVGPIVVEGADHVVAVLPDAVERLDDGRVVVGPARVDVTGRVEPVAAPALAVMRRRQQPLDQAVKRVGSRVADEFVDLLRRRRQADQVERRAANQRRPIGRRRERQAALGELFEQKRVDRRVAPSGSPLRGTVAGGTGVWKAHCDRSAVVSGGESALLTGPP